MVDILKSLIKQFMPFAQKQMGFDRVPRLFLKNDNNEANNPMGKTGFYDPQNESITIYIGKRHPKDIMRSLSHELMHHTQNCKGQFDNTSDLGEQGYAQKDSHLRTMEIQAYQASIVFRDWEDSCKGTIYYEHLQKGENKMSTKDWKNKELTQLLSEAWGFKFNTLEEFNEFNGNGEVQEEEVEATAETVDENTEEPVEESVEEEINEEEELDEAHCAGKRDDEKKKNEAAENDDETLEEISSDYGPGGDYRDSLTPSQQQAAAEKAEKERKAKKARTPGKTLEEEEELEEGGAAQRKGDPRVRRQDPDRLREEEELEEELENPDKADLDDDGKLSSYEKKRGKAIEKSMKKDKKPTKEQIEALVKKALQEALQKRKG